MSTRCFSRWRAWLAAAILVVVAPCAAAQPLDTLAARPVVGAAFEDARALAADPLGRLYVADAGADVVWRLDASSGVAQRLGGPGRSDGAFDDPLDVDPTNGLVLVVADAGNNRIQRLSSEYRHLETLPVRRVETLGDEWSTRPSYRPDDPALADLADGRPVGVAVSRADETFVVDAGTGVVIKYDARRRPERVVGGFSEAAGQLAHPVALALGDDRLFVADAGRGAVLVYDHFGGYVRTLAEGRLRDVRNVALADGRLWVVLPDRLLAFSLRGRSEREVVLRQATGPLASLRDVVRVGRRLYVLTDRRLYVVDQ